MEYKFIKPTNTITIVGEMITDLGLKGNELLVYAIISGFSQDGASAFIGSISYFQEFTSLSRQGVVNILKNLVERGLIKKEQDVTNGVVVNSYRVVKKVDYLSKNLPTCQENGLCLEKRENEEKKVTQRIEDKESKDLKEDKEIKEIYKEKKENEERGMELFDNSINAKEKTPLSPSSAHPLSPHANSMDFVLLDKSIDRQVCPRGKNEQKVKFADFVNMTNTEFEKLSAELGDSGAKECIDILNNYKGSKGKTYKSDYLAIRSWVIDKYKEKHNRTIFSQSSVSPLPPNNSLPKWKAMGFNNQEEYLKAIGR